MRSKFVGLLAVCVTLSFLPGCDTSGGSQEHAPPAGSAAPAPPPGKSEANAKTVKGASLPPPKLKD